MLQPSSRWIMMEQLGHRRLEEKSFITMHQGTSPLYLPCTCFSAAIEMSLSLRQVQHDDPPRFACIVRMLSLDDVDFHIANKRPCCIQD